jgi:hypothetical protein
MAERGGAPGRSRAWAAVGDDLQSQGWALVPGLLNQAECRALRRGYDDDARFRSTITMARHRYGQGEYRYFAYPLPVLVEGLRQSFYERLAPTANLWGERLGREARYPLRLDEFLDRCHRAGQQRPTPLLLRYGAGDYNRLHQDVYGAIGFPFQLLVLLSQAGTDYEGGEVILVENLPRMQSRATAIVPGRGDGLIFPNRERPVAGRQGFVRAQVRHGASEVRRGERLVLGVIFHDAE